MCHLKQLVAFSKIIFLLPINITIELICAILSLYRNYYELSCPLLLRHRAFNSYYKHKYSPHHSMKRRLVGESEGIQTNKRTYFVKINQTTGSL